MRLIDADVLLQKYATYCGEESCEKCKFIEKDRCNIYKTIAGTPTAFDVDKVVERLKEVGQLELKTHGGRCNGKTLAIGYAKGIENAIKIVKKEGGMNEGKT